MTIDELKTYKRILIVGYGLEGKASESFIKKFHPTAEIGIADQKDTPHYLEMQKDYDLAIRTPLLRPEKLTIPYTTGTNLFFGNVRNPIIGVTGTKGKSTTVGLLHHVLLEAGKQSRLYGNIGDPMLHAFEMGIDKDDIFVLELSSYQLEDIKFSPHIACFLNMYHELHNHPTYENYAESKSHIASFQTQDDYLFYNGSVPETDALTAQAKSHRSDFSQIAIEHLISDVPYTTHADNFKAVYAIAHHLGVSDDQFFSAIRTFKPLPHRIEKVGTFQHVTFYDDSASVHPNATILALQSLDSVDTVILGGQDRGYEFAELAQELHNKNVKNILLFPETDKKIYNDIENVDGYVPHIVNCLSMEEAVEKAFELTAKGSICLLSPGAPSYLMYNNLSERGVDFHDIVLKYGTTSQKENIQEDLRKQGSGGSTS